MCMIDHLDELCAAGISSLKIEGRAKSAYYAAIVTGAYRHCLDAAAAGKPLDPVWRDEVEHVSHRRYSTGFFYGQPGQYIENSRYIRNWQVEALVVDCDENGNATLSLRNKMYTGEEVEVVGPDCRPFAMRPIEDDVDRSLLTAALKILSPREKEIITLRFGLNGGQERTQKEVADHLGISQSYISRLEKRIIQRLKKEILRLS